MLAARRDICELFNADHFTLYAISEDRTPIISKLNTGLNTSRNLKLLMMPRSIAGYVAWRGRWSISSMATTLPH